MGDRVNREEIEKANDVHILDYLDTKGEKLIKQGKYYRHAEHDSLVIHQNGRWFWNSRGEGGYGAISFARTFYNLRFQDAVRDINGLEIKRSFENTIAKEEGKEFVYPKQYESATQNNAINYLVNERMIDKKIVAALIKSDYIAEDRLKNIVFKWKDSAGKIIGADRQGTVRMNTNRGYFKQVVQNSKEDGGFRIDIGKPNKLALFESPIDAISYYELYKPNNIRLHSMSGLKDISASKAIKDIVKDCTEQKVKLEKVIFAVDNDKAGKEFSERWEKLIGISEIQSPKLKDWNMDLKQSKTIEKQYDNVLER